MSELQNANGTLSENTLIGRILIPGRSPSRTPFNRNTFSNRRRLIIPDRARNRPAFLRLSIPTNGMPTTSIQLTDSSVLADSMTSSSATTNPKWNDNMNVFQNNYQNTSTTAPPIFKNMKNPILLGINNDSDENGYLCGFPGICKGSTDEIYTECANTTLLDCDECGVSRGALFMFFVVCLGVGIMVGNILIILVGYRRYKKGKQTKMDICRISLAAADFTTGIELLVVMVYNFSWSMNLTPFELDAQQLALQGSPQAIAGGILNIFSFTSSLYHLIYMGLERLYAIAVPVKYKYQSLKAVYIGLGLVWILTLTTASIPAWFPDQIIFTYLASAFVFASSPVECDSPHQTTNKVFAVVAWFYLVPYCLMTITSIISGLLVGQRIKGRKSMTSSKAVLNAADKQVKKAYWTVAIMQIGFTVAVVPDATVHALIYSEVLNCSNISLPLLGCAYVSMTSSFINVIIYNVRDKEFRSEMAAIWSWRKSES